LGVGVGGAGVGVGATTLVGVGGATVGVGAATMGFIGVGVGDTGVGVGAAAQAPAIKAMTTRIATHRIQNLARLILSSFLMVVHQFATMEHSPECTTIVPFPRKIVGNPR